MTQRRRLAAARLVAAALAQTVQVQITPISRCARIADFGLALNMFMLQNQYVVSAFLSLYLSGHRNQRAAGRRCAITNVREERDGSRWMRMALCAMATSLAVHAIREACITLPPAGRALKVHRLLTSGTQACVARNREGEIP